MRKLKKSLAILAAAVLMLGILPLQAFAEPSTSGVVGDVAWEYDIMTGVLTLTGSGSGEMGDGSSAADYEWNEWGPETLTFSGTIAYIGAHAFQGQTMLRSVEIPEGVTSIEPQAFEGCTALESVVLPTSLEYVVDGAFANCPALSSITLPDSVRSVGEGVLDGTAFYNDGANWSGGAKENGALYCGNHLVGAKNTFDFGAFAVRAGTLTVAKKAFSHAEKLTGIDLPDSLVRIGGHALEYTGISDITVPAGIAELPESMCESCSALKNVTLSDGLTVIGENAFADCTALERIEIPASVVRVDADAFSGCALLADVRFNEGLQEIGSNAFAYCAAIESVDIPASVLVIGASAFSHCSALTDVRLHDGLDKILTGAFADCTSLKKIVIPDSVTFLYYSIFENCTALETVRLPAGTLYLPDDIFSGCTALNSVTIPSGISSIYSRVFKNAGITTLYLPKSVTEIRDDAFLGSGIKTVYYEGSASEWAAITIDATGNDELAAATIVYDHTHTEGDAVTEDEIAATCTADGSYNEVVYCKDCGIFMSETAKTVIAPGHVFVEDAVLIEASCNTEGKMRLKCTACGETKTEPIPAIGSHDFVIDEVLTEAGCLTDGVQQYKCSRCGETKTEPIPAVGSHDFVIDEVLTEAGCLTDGVQQYKCSRCGETKTEPIPAFGSHDFVLDKVLTEAGCETDGERQLKCSRCGEIKTETVPALGHDFGADVVALEADCVTNGQILRVCERCGINEIEYTPTDPDNHRLLEWYDGIANTCYESGTLGHFHCAGCGKNFNKDMEQIDEFAVPPKQHRLVFYRATPSCAAEWLDVSAGEPLDEKITALCYCTYCYTTWVREGKTSRELDRRSDEFFDLVAHIAAPVPHEFNKKGVCNNCGVKQGEALPPVSTPGTGVLPEEGRTTQPADAPQESVPLSEIAAPAEEQIRFRYVPLGDVNGNGRLDASDARAALRLASKLALPNVPVARAADADGSGRITSTDARYILRIAAKLEPAPEKTIALAN